MSDSEDSSSVSSSSSEEEIAVAPPSKKQRVTSAPLEIAPSVQSTEQQRKASQASKQKIIILLDQARLETVKNRKGLFELLNCDDHRDL
eukprot:5393938-Ditylum_brightwellii.AAC.1